MSGLEKLKPPEADVSVVGAPVEISTLMANWRGPLPHYGSFSSHGGPLHISVSGSGKRRSNVPPGIIGMEVRLDDEEIGKCQVFVDAEGKRGTFIPVFITVSGISPGRHDLALHPFNRTETDENDFFNAAIIEYEPTEDRI